MQCESPQHTIAQCDVLFTINKYNRKIFTKILINRVHPSVKVDKTIEKIIANSPNLTTIVTHHNNGYQPIGPTLLLTHHVMFLAVHLIHKNPTTEPMPIITPYQLAPLCTTFKPITIHHQPSQNWWHFNNALQ